MVSQVMTTCCQERWRRRLAPAPRALFLLLALARAQPPGSCRLTTRNEAHQNDVSPAAAFTQQLFAGSCVAGRASGRTCRPANRSAVQPAFPLQAALNRRACHQFRWTPAVSASRGRAFRACHGPQRERVKEEQGRSTSGSSCQCPAQCGEGARGWTGCGGARTASEHTAQSSGAGRAPLMLTSIPCTVRVVRARDGAARTGRGCAEKISTPGCLCAEAAACVRWVWETEIRK